MNIVAEIEKENMKEDIPQFRVGDLVDVHVKTVEGEKERIQIFNGTVISKKGGGSRATFTVRRVVQGEGVERVFPVHSPNVVNIVVKKSYKTRRAKLYYLRDRKGKSARLKEIRRREKKTNKAVTEAPGVENEDPGDTAETPVEVPKAKKAPKARKKAKKKDEKSSTKS
jgi:large subunit ribosomal protein L19